LPAQRGEQAHIVQKRRAQLLDDAPLQVDSGGKILLHAIEPQFQVRMVFAQVLFGPGDVHARAHEQAAELVVQFARQAGLFAFRDILQMGGELDQFAGPVFDLTLELLLLITQLSSERHASTHIQPHQARGNEHQQHVENRAGQRNPSLKLKEPAQCAVAALCSSASRSRS